MAASPVTGDRPTGFRRSSSQFASIPQRSLSFHEKVGLAKDDAAADVLYTHPSVRIYTFQPPTDALNTLDKTKKTLPDADYPIDAIEILPWRARTETIAARGKLIIEKVQGSVHFLKAGTLIHTIMKNSQCWCVDGESKFVMRVGRLRYQRIEMPTTNSEEKQKVEEFKEVISKILKFEKTPCPFIRAFQVDLPEDAITPRRRGTWRRKESLTSVTADEESRPARRTKTARTMSMRAMPPNSFPSRSLTQLEMERPRTASTPSAAGRFSFPDVRAESPTTYTSGEDNTDSDRHDSESDRPDTGHSSEVDESDRELGSAAIAPSPLNYVQTLSPVYDKVHSRKHDTIQRHDPPAEEQQQQSAVTGPMAALSGYKLNAPDITSSTSEVLDKFTREKDSSPRTTSSNIHSNDAVSVSAMVAATNNKVAQLLEPINMLPANRNKNRERRTTIPTVQPVEPMTETVLPPPEQKDAPLPETEISVSDTPQEEITKPSLDRDVVHEENARPEDSETSNTNVQAPLVPISQNIVHEEDARLDDPPTPDTNVQGSLAPISQEIATPEETQKQAATLSSENLSRSKTNDDAESTMSTDSFHTTLSDDDNVSAHTTSLGTRPFQHRREISEITVTAASVHETDTDLLPPIDSATEETATDPELSVPSNEDHTWPEMRTPGAFTDDFEIRRRLKHRRSLSPLPPASILHSSNQGEHGSPIPAMLLQKAATMAVVKPLEVVVFVMQVLARIAGGATMNDLVSGDLFRNPGVRRTASGTFDQDLRGRSAARDSDEEDDYGIPVNGRRKSSNKENGRPGFTLDRDIDDSASFASID